MTLCNAHVAKQAMSQGGRQERQLLLLLLHLVSQQVGGCVLQAG
jgi:hypothetical protein